VEANLLILFLKLFIQPFCSSGANGAPNVFQFGGVSEEFAFASLDFWYEPLGRSTRSHPSSVRKTKEVELDFACAELSSMSA
jgi:hypothetical protein